MSNEIEKLLRKAEHLIDLDRFREAVPLLGKVLAQNPEHYEAHCMLSACHFSLKDYGSALKSAEKAVAADPESEEGHRLRSLSLGELGRKKEALQAAEESVRLEPYDLYALQNLVNSYLNVRRLDEAETTALRIRELYPETEAAFFSLGLVYLERNKNFEAERAFRDALRINPNSSDSRNNLGVALLRQSYDESPSAASKRLSILEGAREEKIHEHFSEAMRLNPNHELAAENLKNQFSYLNIVGGFAVFLPIFALAFPVLPWTGVFFLIWVFSLVKLLWETRQNKKQLSPELKMFLKADARRGFRHALRRFFSLAADFYRKTWAPHLLAIVAFAATFAGKLAGGPASAWSRGAGIVLMIASAVWLVRLIRRD